MATHPSAEKRHKQNIVRRDRNRQLRSQLRGALKSIRSAIDGGEASNVAEALKNAQSLVDRMVAKGIIHRNTAARYKSRLTRSAAKTSAAA